MKRKSEEESVTTSEAISISSNGTACPTNAGKENSPVASSVSSSERYFWKKYADFEPCFPAPDHVPLEMNPMNPPPQEYVSKYIPESIFSTILEQSNRTYVELGRYRRIDYEWYRRYQKVFFSLLNDVLYGISSIEDVLG